MTEEYEYKDGEFIPKSGLMRNATGVVKYPIARTGIKLAFVAGFVHLGYKLFFDNKQ